MIRYIKYFFAINILILFSSCEKNEDISQNLDTLKSKLDSIVTSETPDSLQQINFSSTLNDFITKSGAADKWIYLNLSNKSQLSQDLKRKLIVLPLFESQIDKIKSDELNDSSVVFLTDKNISFVFDISGGEKIIKNIPQKSNALLIVRIKDIKSFNKIYLVKKPTDYLHKELKVIEFYMKCDFIELTDVKSSGEILKKRFQVSPF